MSKPRELTDLPALIKRVRSIIEDTQKHRGGTQSMNNPLEIHLYNMATAYKRQLEGFCAMLEDANGTYMQEQK
jgi:hypothetical protein